MDFAQWMKQIDSETPLSLINIPGTHDSATKHVSSLVSAGYVCQNSSIYRQLQDGARFIDLRLEYVNGKFMLVHAAAKCTDENGKTLFFDEIFSSFAGFLKDNPSETIIASVKMDAGKNYDEFFKLFYERYISGNLNIWYLKNEIPLLKDVRGKIILVRRCVMGKCDISDAGLDFSNWPDQGNRKSSQPIMLSMNDSCHALVQDRYMHPKKAKWSQCIEPFLNTVFPNTTTFCLNFMSAAIYPKGNAKYINSAFLRYEVKRKPYGIIIADFLDRQISEKIIMTNEGYINEADIFM